MRAFEVAGDGITVRVNEDLSLTVRQRDGRMLWATSSTQPPTLTIRRGNDTPRQLPLAQAQAVLTPFDDGRHRGQTVRLSGFAGSDVVLDLTFAVGQNGPLLDGHGREAAPATDELLVEAVQVGGRDVVVSLEQLYRIEKPVPAGGYLVLPHGSGYLIPADCPDELPGQGHVGGFIGARWTLPLFGIVRGADALCVLVDTWWDCEVEADHAPGEQSSLAFHWRGSIGKLAYRRRFRVQFATGLDYVGMAKIYREQARREGLLRTLEEKAVENPGLRHDLDAVLYRWPAWNPDDGPGVLDDLQALRELGFAIKFFFPKWSSSGYAPERGRPTTATSGWQSLLLETPVPGGWETLAGLADAVHQRGCSIQGFIAPRSQEPEGPDYDEDRWPRDADGLPIHNLSTHDAVERLSRGLDHLAARGLKLDTLYFDGYAAFGALAEDFSPQHPVTRRMTYEAQNAAFAETRRRGIVPAGELARFWCIADCDYFFFTDWSSDRLANTSVQGAPAPVGEPVPLFQLVFHDCFSAGFSGGGYALYSAGYDWWEERTPRLYELLYAAAPAYNWLPGGAVPLGALERGGLSRKLNWLRRWRDYYCAIATSELVSHAFLTADRTLQQVEFANGVCATFNMAANELRVENVPGFSGEWEQPEQLG